MKSQPRDIYSAYEDLVRSKMKMIVPDVPENLIARISVLPNFGAAATYDMSTNAAMVVAGFAKRPALDVAADLAQALNECEIKARVDE